MNLTLPVDEPALTFGTRVFTWGDLAIGAVFLLALLIVLFVIVSWRNSVMRRHQLELERQRANQAQEQMNAQVSAIVAAQAEMQGRLGTIADVFGSRQNEMTETLQQRLDAMSSRIGQSMTEQQKATHENLSKLQERLAVIDTAQTNIQNLATNVVQLQSILSNKQTRGAFGQSRMEAIIADGLPQGAYDFQPTLSNGTRPDCIVAMPNDGPGLVVDAKFPLEGWNAMREADGGQALQEATRRFRNDMDVHIRAIAEKYLLKGETQETAFLFVPSESIFADIHEHHGAIIDKAHKARVVIVSPSLLMLSVQVIQALLKDVRMREQAHLIQLEVTRLMEDVMRLDDRVRKLQTHFGQATKDVETILTSTDRVTKRGRKIEALDFGPVEEPAASKKPAVKQPPAAESATGQLRLRVVEGDDDHQ